MPRVSVPVLLALVLTTWSTLLPLSTPPAAATESGAQVTLTEVRLTADTLTLTGTLTNAGTRPLVDLTARLWRSPGRLHSLAAIQAALAAPHTTEGTSRAAEPANTTAVVPEGTVLEPGATVGFSVSGSPAALGLSGTGISYWVGVDVTGRAEGAALQTLATPRTVATALDQPVPVATVADLSAPPRLIKTDLFVDDSLADDLSTGRLAALLAAAEQGADWVLDAGLLAEVRDMADGYRVQTTDGNTAGTRAAVAEAWLARLTALGPGRGALGLVGTPDVVATTRLGDEAVLEHALRATERAPLAGLRPALVLRRPDAAAAAAAVARGRTAIAVDSPLPVHTTLGGAPLLSASPPPPDLSGSPVLADTPTNRQAVALALARARGGALRWLRTDAEAADAQAPLPADYRAVPLADLAEGTPVAIDPLPEDPAAPEASGAVTATSLPHILALGERLATYGALTPQSGIAEVADAQVARAASVWWAGEDDASRTTWLAGIDRRIDFPTGEPVSLGATPRFSMTAATSDFPVTVTNHLSDPVTLRLRAETDYPQRIRFAESAPVTVPPGASNTVIMRAEASGGGVVRARVHAETLGGHRLTPDAEVVVETTNFGVIGWVLVIGSGIVLVATTAIRIRQVRIRQRTLTTEEGHP